MSRAFEGYKREMSTIENVPTTETHPVVSFSESVLKALTRRPGRIYEGKQEDITPANSMTDTLIDVLNKAIDKIK